MYAIVYENDLPRRETGSHPGKVIQNSHQGASAVPAWWKGQDISPSPTDIFVVGGARGVTFTPKSSGTPYDISPTHSRFSLLMADRVPKELISRFVKICPTCQVRRGGSRLTPPSSRRGSPRLISMPRSPKLPSPPMSRRESTFNNPVNAERTQPEYFYQAGTSNGWTDSHRNLQGRQSSNLSLGPMRSFNASATGSVPPTIDPFHAEMSPPSSQVGYNPMYVSSQGSPSH